MANFVKHMVMSTEADELRRLIVGMRAAFLRGENAMAYARSLSPGSSNTVLSTLVAYDLQAGSYVEEARKNRSYNFDWCLQLSRLLEPYIEPGDTVLEVGVGEATTLAGVMKALRLTDIKPMGFDVSWSRIAVARDWVSQNGVSAALFVGDLFHIPLANESIDVVYTSHSLEPNGGKEECAIAELMRVARKAVVLIEPIYELASEQARQRMSEHRYVKDLKKVAECLGATVVRYELLSLCSNPLNPSGVVLLEKSNPPPRPSQITWQCPLTDAPLRECPDYFLSDQTGIAYPILNGIPLLRPQHAVVASLLGSRT